MKCLFCGKDLPLLKRLSGAEFCSDEHRQQYQQEYSELAVSRLAQQKAAAAHKTALPVKQQPAAEPTAAPSKDVPKVSAGPSMKLADTKADGRKSSRPVSEPKSNEPRIAATPAAPPKPALVSKSSRPAIAPATVTPASPTPVSASAEMPRPEAKKLSITPANAKPSRSVVPLQESKPLRVTETRSTEPKADLRTPAATEAKAAEPPRPAPAQEPARTSRTSAHAPLRLELPVGPASSRLMPERRLIPTPEVQRPVQKREVATTPPMATLPGNAPISGAHGEPREQTAFEQRATGDATSHVPLADVPVIEEAAHRIEEAALKIQQAALKIEGATLTDAEPVRQELVRHEIVLQELVRQELVRQEVGGVLSNEPVSAKPVQEAAPEVPAPAPLAGLELSQPPPADWRGPTRIADLQMATVLMPVLARGGIRARAAGLNGAKHLSSGDILTACAPPLRVSPVRLEIREFARMEPVLEFKPIVDTPHVPTADQATELTFLAAVVQAEPKLWAEAAREFGTWLDPAAQAALLETLAAGFDVLKDAAAVAQVPSEEGAVRPGPMVNGKAETPAIDLSQEPRAVTLSKPVAPEGVPGGKAKPMQMFTSTLRESVQAAIPYPDTLPLRATIVMGPADGSVASTDAFGGGRPE